MIYEGEMIGGTYRVLKQIGRGGTGLVFLAFHLNLRKKVVIKRVQAGIANIESLRAETDILKNLHNSHIPQVYDFLVRGGEVFTVMDYIEGTPFDGLSAGKRHLSEDFLVNLLLQIGQTLSYLHRHKPPVIHSDIKPDNLILKPDGEVCLIDFNISISSTAPSGLSGYSMHFASPEQWRRSMDLRSGRRPSLTLDARTDIYSTGALFYYLATGLYPDTRQPGERSGGASGRLASGSPYDIDASLLYRDMAARGYSDAFCSLIGRCLSRERRLRYADGAKLYAAVRHLRRQDGRFRKYLALRAASWILTAMLTGSGSWFLIRGVQQGLRDDYASDMTAFTRMLSEEDLQAASDLGAEILNNNRYSELLKEKPGDASTILQAMGDAAFSAGQYGEAQLHYGEALEEAVKWSSKEQVSISRYYRDYAVALVKDGQIRRAQIILEEAEAAGGSSAPDGISDPDTELVKAYILLAQDETDGCIQGVSRILEMAVDGDLKARACTIAADACKKDNEEENEISWLRKATEYSGLPEYQRLLAAAWWSRAADTRRSREQQEYSARQAMECYERLASRPQALMDDVISLVVAKQFLGRYEESLRILSPLLESSPDEYRVPMYMAFAYDAMDDRYNASRYAEMALDIYESLPYDRRPGMEGDELRYLREIR